ncbi:SseB family protein [Endothiovibrio diazotrophicus]
MSEVFEPRNALEETLLAAQEGRVPGEQFLQELMAAQLFMPVRDKHNIGGFQDSATATPLTIDNDEGQPVMVLFTSPERAGDFLGQFPGYGGGLLVEFKWVLEKMGGLYPVSINPNWEVGIDLDGEILQHLAASAS